MRTTPPSPCDLYSNLEPRLACVLLLMGDSDVAELTTVAYSLPGAVLPSGYWNPASE